MRIMKQSFAIVLLSACFAVSEARGSAIVVSFASDGSDCTGSFAIGPVTWYLVALLDGGPTGSGITGAEFRQTGTPEGWFLNAVASPSSIINVGSPITPNGAWIGFPSCQTGSFVLLYTVSGFAPTQVTNHCLNIEAHAFPSNPQFTCPLFTLCDAPVFTRICVPGRSGIIGGDGCDGCTVVGVESKSWSEVKALYTN